ncbi:MAG: phosphoribosyl-ATP diphosphatase [Clostridia bacterium]|nr:phosphoribosyl-ATP diphosphatase [Clostridia bacterium]
MSTKKELNLSGICYDGQGFIPVIAQDYESGEVLLLGKMNQEAVKKTFETDVVYYCDEAGKLRKFGDTLGNTQKLVVAFLDDAGKTLLIKVRQKGKACPEKDSYSQFVNQLKGEYKEIGGEMFGRLQRIVDEYKKNPEDGAYTSFLFARGVDRIGKKVGEEAVEFVIAAKNEDPQGVVNEAADLLYHTVVLLSARGVKISEVCKELCKRNR